MFLEWKKLFAWVNMNFVFIKFLLRHIQFLAISALVISRLDVTAGSKDHDIVTIAFVLIIFVIELIIACCAIISYGVQRKQ